MVNRSQEIPSFTGIKNYPQAFESLLADSTTIGAVVVRECFNPDDVVSSGGRVYFGQIMSDNAILSRAESVQRRWWQENSYPDMNVNGIQPDDVGRIHNAGHYRREIGMLASQRYAFGIYPALEGNVSVFVSPGIDMRFGHADRRMDDTRVTEAANQSKKLETRLTKVAHAQVFPFASELAGGDMLIVMGHPVPADRVIIPRKKGRSQPASSYADFNVRQIDQRLIRQSGR